MKQLFPLVLALLFLFSCSSSDKKNQFTVKGKILHASDQPIYLERLHFHDDAPEVLDTAQLTKGLFTLTAIAEEEGLFRIRLQEGASYLVINDQPDVSMEADLKDPSMNAVRYSTPANRQLSDFILQLITRSGDMQALQSRIDSLQQGGNDSLMKANRERLMEMNKKFLADSDRYSDTCKNPVLSIFAAGNMPESDPAQISRKLQALKKRFPRHNGIAEMVKTFEANLNRQNKPAPSNFPGVGDLAPDITMNDTEGKPFSLSQLRGKYVLVDFWASWCGPCRGENPNVVAAYRKYKDKNFTVLGVSLDEDKGKWLEAIQEDGLIWKQISDLQGWNCAAVAQYGFDGIPYNVLLDPEGRILAQELREQALDAFLAKTLK